MDEPNKAASRILAGTGFGLFLVAGFGLIEGRSQWDSFSMGHVFVILGILCILLSRSILNLSIGPIRNNQVISIENSPAIAETSDCFPNKFFNNTA